MAFGKNKDLKYTIKEDGINEVIEENGNMITMLREVAWNDKEPKLEMRKWIINPDTETPMKGLSFMTEKGPHSAAELLVKHGYGETKTLLGDLSTREDFENGLISTIGKKKVDETKQKEEIIQDDYLDPKGLL